MAHLAKSPTVPQPMQLLSDDNLHYWCQVHPLFGYHPHGRAQFSQPLAVEPPHCSLAVVRGACCDAVVSSHRGAIHSVSSAGREPQWLVAAGGAQAGVLADREAGDVVYAGVYGCRYLHGGVD